MGTDEVPPLVVAAVPGHHHGAAARLAAEAMRDNPMHVAALGPDARRRVEAMHEVFETMLATGTREVIGAWHADRLVGVVVHTPAAHCQPGPGLLLKLLPAAARAGPRLPRLVCWLAAWRRRDPGTPHCHLGPVGVDPRLRGTGIGSALLTRYVETLEVRDEVGYLETDGLANVRLYRRFGFVVVDKAHVLGVPNWFMARPR